MATSFNCFTEAARKPMEVTFLTLLLVVTWALLHHYQGLTLDAELYAFQAFARLHPPLRLDVYLSGTSQDKYTFFSPLYASLIRSLGLWDAAAALFAICTLGFAAATWSLARILWDKTRAWLATATSIILVCNYGAYGVFHYSESYLTARSVAEVLVITALASHCRGMTKLSWIIACVSMLIHPLMALPGLILLTCLSLPILYSLLGAIVGILFTLAVASLAVKDAHVSNFLPLISGDWLEVVRERSQFLFLENWRLEDWEEHGRAILSLGIAALSAERPEVRRLCLGATVVGVAGLLVALIASKVGPVAILLQGQAWRWFWLAGFMSVIALVPTAIRLWKDGGCGSVCAVLLIASWTFPPVNGTLLVAAALCLFYVRGHVRPSSETLFRALALAMIASILAWTAANTWSMCVSPPVQTGGEPVIIERLRSIYALQLPALGIFALAMYWAKSGANFYVAALAIAALITLCIVALPGSFARTSAIATDMETESTLPWRRVIPETSNVLMVPTRNSAAFIWFSLQRPSYLSTDQSAGVVFSKSTAQEIRRRSEVLLPISEPDWKIMSELNRGDKDKDKRTRPLTWEGLLAICSDPQLGFVIARELIGTGLIRTVGSGRWKDWNLYNCGEVRQQESLQ